MLQVDVYPDSHHGDAPPRTDLDASDSGLSKFESILRYSRQYLEPKGFEIHPFLVGWYNELVDPRSRLPFPDDCASFVVISVPSMFEKTFLPFVLNWEEGQLRDPIDQCMIECLSAVKEDLQKTTASSEIVLMHDFELHPNKRPKFFAQTAAHVSGAAYLYQVRHLSVNPWQGKKTMGLCLHPKYGGWFAVRSCFIFPGVLCPSLPPSPPIDVLPTEEERKNALELFNFHWRDNRFRDVIPVVEKYSAMCQAYFSELPGRRAALVEDLRRRHLAERISEPKNQDQDSV